MKERRLYAVALSADLLPEVGEASRFALPDHVEADLDVGGWVVVSHTVGLAADGVVLLTLYAERTLGV